MKDTHNVILIFVSSSELNSLFRRLIKFSFSFVHFFPGVPSSLNYLVTEIHLNHYKFSPCVFNFFYFRLIILLFTGVPHGGSSRILFILQLFSKISFEAMIRQDILQVFFFLQSGVQFLLPYHLRWYYVILDNLNSCFMIHRLLRMGYFKSINLFIGVILCHGTPKAFPKECCYCGAYQ